MGNIVSSNSGADVINQHVADLFGSMLAVQQGSTKHSGKGFGYVLMFGNRGNLVWRQVTEADQVLERDHGNLPFWRGSEYARTNVASTCFLAEPHTAPCECCMTMRTVTRARAKIRP